MAAPRSRHYNDSGKPTGDPMMHTPILLVEDNPDDEELALRALRKTGVPRQVLVARDGQEALDCLFSPDSRLQISRRPPGLILLDWKLPGLSGLEVLRRVRAEAFFRFTPVVIMSTSSDMGDISASYQHGANSHVRKPVDFQQFSELIRHVAYYWLSLNEPAST
jgi:CheY-like chemotaxis protein